MEFSGPPTCVFEFSVEECWKVWRGICYMGGELNRQVMQT
jgi:hypothetical protein